MDRHQPGRMPVDVPGLRLYTASMLNRYNIFIYPILAAALLLPGGCGWFGGDDSAAPPVEWTPVESMVAEQQKPDGPMSTPVGKIELAAPPPERPLDQLVYRLRVYYIVEMVSEAERVQGFWSMVDEEVVAAGQRQLLRANGMRVGVGGELALARINDALSRRQNVQLSRAPEAYGPAGMFLDIPLGRLQSDTIIIHADRSGGMSGREFNQGSAILRFQCVAQPDDPRKLNQVRLGPYILHGQPGVMTRAGIAAGETSTSQPTFPFRDLETVVRLGYGQFVMVGLEPGRKLSIGNMLFDDGQTPSRRITTVVLVPEVSWMGEVPPERLIYSERIEQVAPPRR